MGATWKARNWLEFIAFFGLSSVFCIYNLVTFWEAEYREYP